MPLVSTVDDTHLIEWQKSLPDNLLLSQLTIPGTHNSAASHLSFCSVKCQGASITEQLNHGVRFLDLRVARPFLSTNPAFRLPNSDPCELQIVHGRFPVRVPFPLKLRAVMSEIHGFLSKHPSEGVLLSIKLEGDTTSWSEDEFPNQFWRRYIAPVKNRWFLDSKIPTVGQIRGKIVLFRRLETVGDGSQGAGWGPAAFGFEAPWKRNTPNDDYNQYNVQDWYEVNRPSDIETKKKYVDDQVVRAVTFNKTADASNPSKSKLFLNYCSGSNFFNPLCWPRQIAKKVNPSIKTDQPGMGIVIVDYAEDKNWDACRRLVEVNITTPSSGVSL